MFSSLGRLSIHPGPECSWMRVVARCYLPDEFMLAQAVAFDQSLAMLRRARERLRRLSGGVPEHVRLVQADLSDLPFRRKSFRTVLCLNVLHQFADARALVSGLNELLSESGNLYLTSLITSNRIIGDWYLEALYRTGEFVRPRDEREVRELFVNGFYAQKGNMAFVRADRVATEGHPYNNARL
jgi:ubiquinone/menaquinone biosynthesis C-methylase UbiE